MSSYHTKNFRPFAPRVGAFSLPHFLLASSLAFLLAMLLPVSASATDSKTTPLSLEDARWFQVELILFAQKNGEPLEAEQWPDLEGVTLPEDMLELHLPATPSAEISTNPDESIDPAALNDDAEPPADPSSALPDAYQILGDDALQLTDIAKKIKRSSRFKTLLHIAWQQPTYDRQHAQPIFFMEGMADPSPIEPAEEIPLTDAPLPDDIPPVSMGESQLPPMLEYATEADTKTGPPNPQFVGTVTLSVERYLHLAADLIYRQPVTQKTAVLIPDLDLWYDRPYPTLSEPQGPAYRLESWQAMRGFRLKESRRMRSKIIHYLDHPFMGLVVVITPVELPEQEEEIQQTSPQNILLSVPKKR